MENSCLLPLVEKFRKGDMSVFPVIFSEFEGLIKHYDRKCEAEDTAEELSVFLLELLYKVDTSRFTGLSGDGLSRYIAVSIRNRYIAYSSQNDRFKKAVMSVTGESAYSEDFLKLIFIKDALKYLTPKQKKVLTFKYIYDYSDTEISSRLNITRQAANRIKNRAIERLKEYI